MKKVALITLHGMGVEDKGYYLELEKKLKDSMEEEWLKVSFQTVQYASILQRPQMALWNHMKANPENDIDFTKLRKYLLFGFGDAGSLENSAHRDAVKYIQVQEEIQRALLIAYNELGKEKTKPVVIIAQSLGCQVISNYLWDAEHNLHLFKKTSGISEDSMEFTKLKSLSNLLTTGCNIPLFISGIENRESFKKPNENFRWDNYYDSDDILGWPLQQLGPSFRHIHDHAISSGGIFMAGNPFSHLRYWSDSDVIRPLANILFNHLSA